MGSHTGGYAMLFALTHEPPLNGLLRAMTSTVD